MLFYHITKRENVQSILERGLRPSEFGLDGPGVYMWKGPLVNAISEADWSLSDNHYKMTDSEYAEFKQQLAVVSITLPTDTKFSVDYPEYVVHKDAIPASCIAYCGVFYDLVEDIAEGGKPMRLDLQFILESLSKEEHWKPGDHVSFFFDNWNLSLKREEDQYKPFTFSVSGSKQNTDETITRRYLSMEKAFLHILNRFNENANVKNVFQSLSDIVERFPDHHGLLLTDRCDIENGNRLYAISLEPGYVVDVKVCAEDGLLYIMQNSDGSTVHAEGNADLTFPDYRYDEAAVVKFAKEEHAFLVINEAIESGVLHKGPYGGVMVYKHFEDGSEGWREVDKAFAAKDLVRQDMVHVLFEKIQSQNQKHTLSDLIQSASSRASGSYPTFPTKAKEPEPDL